MRRAIRAADVTAAITDECQKHEKVIVAIFDGARGQGSG
jgi:hypothetical protein